MDIARQVNKKSTLRRYWPIVAVAAVILAVFAVVRNSSSATYAAERNNLIFGDVKRGDFLVQIRGVGSLVPKNLQWLGSNVDGRVDRIAVDAGAPVKVGDVIVVLSNPKLKEQLEESDWELAALAKEHRAAEMEVAAELADLRADASASVSDYRSAKLKLDAEQQLVEQGIVSKLTFGQSKLLAEQYKERIKFQGDRVAMMEANLAALKDAHAARMNKMRNMNELIQQQIDDLTVRATIDGIVQEMALKLGQQVTQGVEVAKIVPHDNLVAILDIQDFQARDIALEQRVSIDTRSSKITGKVTRIDPAVTNGVVKVEVALVDKMPPEARPDLSIEGVIDVDHRRNTLYVNRPTFAQSNSKASLYLLDEDGSDARRVGVEFGRASTRYIEVVNGLKEGDRIIVSDPSAWESHDTIQIK